MVTKLERIMAGVFWCMACGTKEEYAEVEFDSHPEGYKRLRKCLVCGMEHYI